MTALMLLVQRKCMTILTLLDCPSFLSHFSIRLLGSHTLFRAESHPLERILATSIFALTSPGTAAKPVVNREIISIMSLTVANSSLSLCYRNGVILDSRRGVNRCRGLITSVKRPTVIIERLDDAQLQLAEYERRARSNGF